MIEYRDKDYLIQIWRTLQVGRRPFVKYSTHGQWQMDLNWIFHLVLQWLILLKGPSCNLLTAVSCGLFAGVKVKRSDCCLLSLYFTFDAETCRLGGRNGIIK